MEASRKNLEKDYVIYQSSMQENIEKMQRLLQDKDRQLGMIKTQKFVLEESNRGLEESFRQAQDKIAGLLRELANRNSFIQESLQKRQLQSGDE